MFIVGCLFIILVLIWFIRPTKKELKCALITALIIAGSDFVFEFIMGYFKVWVYNFPILNFLGIPIVLFVCFFLWSLAFCIGFTFFKRTKNPRLWRIFYITAISLLLGTYAYFINIKVESKGLIFFAESIGVDTLWFIIGNYLTISLAIIFTAVVYTLILKYLWRGEE